MSRLAKKPIIVPKEVKVEIVGSHVKVQGPKGVLEKTFHKDAVIEYDSEKGEIWVKRLSDSRFHKALQGTVWRIISNMIRGVVQPYRKELIVQGTGYRVMLQGRKLIFKVGYSHDPEYVVPEGVSVQVEGNNRIILESPDKEKIGLVAAQIRDIKRPDPYKGKGIRYADEQLVLKPGKTAAK